MRIKLYIISILFIIFSCSKEKKQNLATNNIALFKSISSNYSHVQFNNKITETNERNHLINFYYYDGGGVAIGDLNNDDLPDIYFVGNMVPDKLYLNKGGLVFEDISGKSGIYKNGAKLWGTGVTMADVNGDGYLDIYVCKADELHGGRNLLLINNKDLTFTESGKKYGLDDIGFASNASFFDYDRDGDLDMYLVNTPPPLYSALKFQKEDMAKTPPLYSDKLYRNDGKKYKDVTLEAGMRYIYAFGLSGTIADLNNDNWPDIFVGNDFEAPDLMYLNQGNGKFKEICKEATKHISNNSMGADIADFNNDGYLDIFTLDMMAEDNYRQKINTHTMTKNRFRNFADFGYHVQYMQNVLNMNNGNTTFSDVAQIAGIHFTDWSWSALFADFDNDGWKDIFITNGILKETGNLDYRAKRDSLITSNAGWSNMELISLIPQVKLSNYLYRNNGNYSFTNMAKPWELNQPSFSNGSAYADLDLDGDLDLVINNCDTIASIYENQLQQISKSNYLQIKLEGSGKNTFGLGTRVEIFHQGKKQLQELTLTRGYYSAVEPILHFGLGEFTRIDSLIVLWPDGKFEKMNKVHTNKRLVLKQNKAKKQKANLQTETQQPIFTEATYLLNLKHKHTENNYNDFEKEKHLPHKYSQLGPAIAVGDIDGDSDEDIFVGGASGSLGIILTQNRDGSFTKSSNSSFLNKDINSEDIGACFFDADNDDDLDLYVASGGNEFDINSLALRDRIYFNDGKGNFKKSTNNLPDIRYSNSCVKPFDFDGDGDLDLFVGGRLVPGKYPLPASSCLLENKNGIFTDVSNTKVPDLNRIGMVTDALWTDVDSDEQTDLVIVGEWMPITVLLNNDGEFYNATEKYGLHDNIGWWYSIDKADFDNDGDMDLVAGNLGLNYKFKALKEEPFYVFSNDFNGNKQLDIVLAHFNFGELVPVHHRDCAIDQIPELEKSFPTYHSYSKSTVYDIYGAEKLNTSLSLQVTNFASSYLENIDGKSFAIKNLPKEAQFSSINDFIIHDFNQDGNLDLLISGNMYHVSYETVRNDAGTGLLLVGDGKGKFSPLPSLETGYFNNNDVKSLRLIQTKSGQVILSANNNDYLKAFIVDE